MREKKAMEIKVNRRSITRKAELEAYASRMAAGLARELVSYRLEARLLGRLFDRVGSGVVKGLSMPLRDRASG